MPSALASSMDCSKKKHSKSADGWATLLLHDASQKWAPEQGFPTEKT
jgi:hypothetical protein